MNLKNLLATAGAGAWLAFDTASGLPVVATISLGTIFAMLYGELVLIERILDMKSGV
jgi:hypothetical protein